VGWSASRAPDDARIAQTVLSVSSAAGSGYSGLSGSSFWG